MTDRNTLSDLLEAERTRPDATRGELDAIWGNVARQLDLALPTPISSGNSDAGTSIEGARTAIARLKTFARAHTAAAIMGSFVAGVGVGATAMLTLGPKRSAEPASTVVVTVPFAADRSAAPDRTVESPPSAATTPRDVASTAPASRPPAPGRSTSALASGDTSLGVERALVERARSALARGAPDDALSAGREHAARFPRGRLAEERDFVVIQALRASGRNVDADAAVARFRKTYPTSLLSGALDTVAQ